MTAAAVDVAGKATLAPARDGRLFPYAAVAFGAILAALAAGRPGLVALAVPFVLALSLGLRRRGPVEVGYRLVLDADQVLEGDRVTGRLELAWDGTFDAWVGLSRMGGVAPSLRDAGFLAFPDAEAAEVPIDLQAVRWGRHSLGDVWLRLESPHGLLSWTGRVLAGPALRVLPGRERLDRLLDPPESRAVWGTHPSRRIGDGQEFAELRPYAPGDRLRDLNWAATARRRRPFVNKRHPDLSGDVVIALDALDDGSSASVEALARAARAAWALASVHLRANDRVGLAGLGGSTRWLPPAGGRLAQYRLLETLLGIGGDAAGGVAPARRTTQVPPAALVIALTPLRDPATIRTLLAWRARGRSVAVVSVDPGDLTGAPASASEALARRVWALEMERRRDALTAAGIPIVAAPAGGPIGPVVSALRRARRAPSVRRRS